VIERTRLRLAQLNQKTAGQTPEKQPSDSLAAAPISLQQKSDSKPSVYQRNPQQQTAKLSAPRQPQAVASSSSSGLSMPVTIFLLLLALAFILYMAFGSGSSSALVVR
jgi:hypothetical protein